ncbi:phage portal protein [Methanobrevibacter filiformis]|uniref:Phage portal protein n=1 Tax=Methanobrevibacter filiformis TaxID=55758 RepID=A0A166FFQ7_9EURY|nr:phage portal protein [Methanobrevibacter filiformis]KZX17630.1 phage portal protein [Methanobrevibacter filiformis]
MTQSHSFIVTKNGSEWDLVENDVLEKYAIKTEGSEQINEEQMFNEIDGVLTPLYDPSKLINLLELSTWHERCVDAIASDASGKAWALKPKSNITNPSMEEKIRAEDFFKRIRPSITKLLYKRTYDTRAVGYGAFEVIRENGRDSKVIDLKYIPSHTIRRLDDGVRVVQQVGMKKVYFVMMDKNKEKYGKNEHYYDVDYKTGLKSYTPLPETQRANEIIFTNIHTPRSKYYGQSKIIPAIRVIYGDIHRANYNASFFKNYGMPAFSVVVTGDFEPDPVPSDENYDEKKTLKYNIKKQLQEIIKNPHSALTVMVPTRVGMEESRVQVEIKPLSVDTKEASFRLYRKDNRDEIIAAHGMDPNRLGITESGKLNGSNSEELDNAYKTTVIENIKKDNEDDINYYILQIGLDIHDWEFEIIDQDQKRFDQEWVKVKEALEIGFMTINEAREEVGEHFNITSKDDTRLDEHYYHGQLLGGRYEVKGAGSVYNALENDLIGEGVANDGGTANKYEDSAIIRSIKRLRRTRKIP